MEDFAVVLILLHLLVMIVRYGFGGVLKWLHPESAKVIKDYSYQPTVSVLLPCFNEGQHVYETIKSIRQSDYPTDKLEIIAVDDCSNDDSFSWMEKARDEFPHVQIHKNNTNRGKNKTVIAALHYAISEIVISIDSDTIFAKDTVSELMACFSEPKMGAVGGIVGVINVNESILTSFQTFMYYIAFHLGKIPENYTRTVGCISGCLFAVKRSIMLELEPVMTARHWFGIPTSEGEDRFLTHQIVLKGYGTYINLDAKCWTHVPVTLMQYFKQQLRWRRSALRDLFLTIRTLPAHMKLHPNAVYVFLLLPLTSLLALVALGVSALSDPLFWINPTSLLVYTVASLLVSWAIKRYNKEQMITNPAKLAVFGAWWIVNTLFLTVLAVFTLDSGDWGTRTKSNKELAEQC